MNRVWLAAYQSFKRFSKTLFMSVVSFKWATGRRWQAKLLDTWEVTQMNLHRQKSDKISLADH